jgi:hypothetical protein
VFSVFFLVFGENEAFMEVSSLKSKFGKKQEVGEEEAFC